MLALRGRTYRFDGQLVLRDALVIDGEGGVLHSCGQRLPDKGRRMPAIIARPDAGKYAALKMVDTTIRRSNFVERVGLSVDHGLDCEFRDVIFDGWREGGTALRLRGCQGGLVQACTFRESTLHVLITDDEGLPSTDQEFLVCRFLRAWEDGFPGIHGGVRIAPSPGGKRSCGEKIGFVRSRFEGIRSAPAIRSTNASRWSAIGCRFEANGVGSPGLVSHIVIETTNGGVADMPRVLECQFDSTTPQQGEKTAKFPPVIKIADAGVTDALIDHCWFPATAPRLLDRGTRTRIGLGNRNLAATARAPGPDLSDADATIDVLDGDWRVLPTGTLTAARTIIVRARDLQTQLGPSAGQQLTVTRLDASPSSYTIVNGGPKGGVAVVLVGGKPSWVKLQFDGSDWILREWSI